MKQQTAQDEYVIYLWSLDWTDFDDILSNWDVDKFHCFLQLLPSADYKNDSFEFCVWVCDNIHSNRKWLIVYTLATAV